MRKWFHRWVLSRRWATFIVLGLSFFVFGAGTLNLFFLLKANTNLLIDFGWQAVMDGGARQFVELLVTGYLSMAAYVVFKTCEYRLAHWLGDDAHDSISVSEETQANEDHHPAR